MSIPTQAICHNHQAPFDFVCAVFFELYPVIIALANRLGGKTLDFAILEILESMANDDCESANFGAVEKQAMRCYGYIKKFLERDKTLAEQVRGKVTLSKTEFANGSWLQILVATMAGVNSPHPQKLKIDEVDLIPWVILQEAFSMPQSTDEIKATTVLGSTRKFAHGPMQKLIDNRLAQVFTWCIYEVMEPFPADLAKQQRIYEAFMRKFGNLDILPADMTKFCGFFKWDDLITNLTTLDIDTFLAQWLCQKPESGGLIYPRFDEELNTDNNFVIPNNDSRVSIQLWEDFGYARPTHPDAIGLVAVDLQTQSFTIFDELWLYEMGTQDILIEVIQMLQRNGLVDEKLKDISREQLLDWKPVGSPQVNYAEFFTRVRLWVPDYHGLTEIADRRKYGCPIVDPPKITHEFIHGDCQDINCSMRDVLKMYLKENGIPHVRNFVDERRMKLTPKIKEIRANFLSYSKKRLTNGEWSDEPDKKDDHGPDLCFIKGTKIKTRSGNKNIEDIDVGEMILTRRGYRRVIKSGLTNNNACVYKVTFSNNQSLTATANHPIWIKNKGWQSIDSIHYDDTIETCPTTFGLMIKSIIGMASTIFVQPLKKAKDHENDFMLPFGNFIMELYQSAIIFITKTKTDGIMIYQTLFAYPGLSIFASIHTQKKLDKQAGTISQNTQDQKLHCGMDQKQESNSTKRLEQSVIRTGQASRSSVPFVGGRIKPIIRKSLSFVTRTVNKLCLGQEEESRVLKVEYLNTQPVYNLSVEETPEYYANGVLVHNCHYGSVYNWPNLAYQSFSPDLPPDEPNHTDEIGITGQESIIPDDFTTDVMERVF